MSVDYTPDCFARQFQSMNRTVGQTENSCDTGNLTVFTVNLRGSKMS